MKTYKATLLSKAVFMAIGTLAVQGLQAEEGAAQRGADKHVRTSALEEVVVSARRREESLQDIPASITAFGSQELVKSNIDDIKDYFAKTPNVSFTESGSRGERSISIRGVSNIGGDANALAFYVDEFNIVNGPTTANTGNSNSSVNPQLFDIERIEVLRGPQGTYFGRNATGGAINVTTKKPGADWYGEVNAGYGRLNTWEVSGVVNIPLVEDKLFFRSSAYYQESDGYVKNVNPVGGRSDTEYSSFRAALRALPNESVLIDLSVNYTEEEQGLPELTHDGRLSGGSVGLALAAGLPASGVNEAGLYPSNLKRVNYDLREQQSNEFLTTVGRIEIDTAWFKITSITGYLDTEFESEDNDLDGTSFGFLDQDRQVDTNSFSQEIRFSGERGDNVDWLFGAIYAEDEINQEFSVAPGADGFLGLPPGFLIDTGDILFETDSWAVFGEVSWDITERLNATLGGRYSEDTLFQRVEGVNFGAPDVPGQGEVDFTDFSPRLTLSYQWSDDLTLYGAVSKGFKAGGLQLNVTQQLPIVDYDEETIWNYETGLRMTALDGRLNANLTFFYMDWKDLQVSTNLSVVDPVSNTITFLNITNNAASASSKGLELDFRMLVTDNFEIGGGLGYLEAKFDDFKNAFVLGNTVDLTDKDIPRAPEWTLNLNGEYRYPLESAGELFVRGEWSYRTDSVPTLDDHVPNPQRRISDGFGLSNLRAGLVTDNYRVDLYVENLFDKVYTTTSGGFGFAGASFRPTYRTYGIKFKYIFD